MNRKILFVIIALAFLGYVGYSFMDSVTPYVGIAEAESSKSNVQVKGRLLLPAASTCLAPDHLGQRVLGRSVDGLRLGISAVQRHVLGPFRGRKRHCLGQFRLGWCNFPSRLVCRSLRLSEPCRLDAQR